MKSFPIRLFSAALALAVLAPGLVPAQGRTTSAREALDLVTSQFGPRSTQWLAEMRGTGGIPQPAEWDIVSYDERMPRLLYRFRAGMGRAGDMGPDEDRYPVNVPVGYFSPSQIGVDSVAAFTIAEGEARKAKMAFDSCDYLLRVREFSTDPLWRLELLDARRQIVGKIYISGRTGAVMRTVWIYRDQGGRPRIVDSFAPGGGTQLTGITGSGIREAAEPNGETGIYRTQPPGGAVRDNRVPMTPPQAGAPVAGTPSPSGSIPPPPQPYRPVGPGGNVADNSIPDPPAVSDTPAAPSGGQMRDLREEPPAARRPDPTRPPIEVPGSGGGSSERIPPPPIPPGS